MILSIGEERYVLSLLSHMISFVTVPEMTLLYYIIFHLVPNPNTKQHGDLKDQQWNRVQFRLRVNTSQDQGLALGGLIIYVNFCTRC